MRLKIFMKRIKLIKKFFKVAKENPFYALRRVGEKLFESFKVRFLFNRDQKTLYRLQARDYSYIKLSPETERAVKMVVSAAKKIYAREYNYQSNATRREVIKTFEKAIDYLRENSEKLSYLEIGSAQGLSMATILKIAELKKIPIEKAISIDPYFEKGFFTGKNGIWQKNSFIQINKLTKEKALKLYSLLSLSVNLVEKTSFDGLVSLIKKDEKFNLIYIDALHENINPLVDAGLSLQVLFEGGIIMLDDHYWPDVKNVKSVFDRHLKKLHECWKVVAYIYEKNKKAFNFNKK